MKKPFYLFLWILLASLIYGCSKDKITTEDSGSTEETTPTVSATLALNEINGNGADTEKYIELYNNSTDTINLAGVQIYYNNFGSAAEVTWTGTTQTIGPKSFLLLKGTKGTGDLIKGLSGTKSITVELKDAKGNTLDIFTIGEDASRSYSYSRIPDGTGKWYYTDVKGTPGATNGTSIAGLTEIKESNSTDTNFSTPDWTDATHGKSATPDYDVVFPSDKVKRIDIVFTSQNWTLLNTYLASTVKTATNPNGNSGSCNINVGISLTNMDYVPAEVFCDGKEWYKVGVRFKGNKSLKDTYEKGKKKFSFKLKFNEFEDTYPQIAGQRFHGFKKLNLNNNYGDKSFMRDRVTADLFRDFGMVAARTAYYEVYVNTGSQTIYYGLYTAIEDIDDTAVKTQLGNVKGNLYKPEGVGASFANGLYNTSDMGKENNTDANDYSDVYGLYTTINSSLRTTNTTQWKTNLESIFDVNTFLKFLAVSSTIQNYDIYGTMAHNYYLYNNNNSLMWIPWDHNEAMSNSGPSFTYSSVTSCWPLIRYIMDQSDYYAKYKTYVKDFSTGVFETSKTQAKLTTLQTLIAPYVQQESGVYSFLSSYSEFTSEMSSLKTFVSSRNTAAYNFYK